jgi:hypothetical protein
MKRIRFAALALLALPAAGFAQTAGNEVGGYPNAVINGTFGNIRILADQSATFPCINCTVNLTPAQMSTYLLLSGNLLPAYTTGVLSWNGSALAWVAGGTGNLIASGSPVQYQLSVFVDGTHIGGITPPSTTGVPLIGQGTSGYPIFGALNLAGGSAIVTGQTPVANGGTGLASITTYDLLAGNGTGALTMIPPSPTAGEALASVGASGYPGFSASLPGVTLINNSTIPASAGTLIGATGSWTVGHCPEVATTSPLVFQDSGSSGCGGGGGGAVSSVTAGASDNLTVSPTTGATVVDFASQAAGTACANVTGSPGIPSCGVTMPQLQAALTAANAQLVSAAMPTGPTSDYAPTGFGTTTAVLYLTPASGGSVLDGLIAGSAMQQIFIVNAEAAGGADTIELVNQSSSDSTPANRFFAAGNLVIVPGGGVNCLYLPTADYWWCH